MTRNKNTLDQKTRYLYVKVFRRYDKRNDIIIYNVKRTTLPTLREGLESDEPNSMYAPSIASTRIIKIVLSLTCHLVD